MCKFLTNLFAKLAGSEIESYDVGIKEHFRAFSIAWDGGVREAVEGFQCFDHRKI